MGESGDRYCPRCQRRADGYGHARLCDCGAWFPCNEDPCIGGIVCIFRQYHELKAQFDAMRSKPTTQLMDLITSRRAAAKARVEFAHSILQEENRTYCSWCGNPVYMCYCDDPAEVAKYSG